MLQELEEAQQQDEEDTDVELIPDFFAQVKRPKLSVGKSLRSTVDNTRGPFTVYFVASLMRDGNSKFMNEHGITCMYLMKTN